MAGDAAPEGTDSPVYRPPDYVVIESNDSDICTPLLDSLNTLPPKDRPASVILPMVNRFLIEPWQPRGWRWNSYGVEKVYYWDAAFLDINKDGREDAIFRKATSLHARDYHKTYIVISPTPAALADPMPEEQVRLITEGDRALQTRVFLGGYLSYTELVSLRGEIFVMTGYRYDWWAEGNPGRWWVQLLRVAGDSFQRVCFFKAKQ